MSSPNIAVKISGNASSLTKASKEGSESLSKVGDKGREVGKLLLGAFGAAGVIEAGKTVFEATDKEEAAQAKLVTALKNAHSSWEANSEVVGRATKYAEGFGYSSAQTKDALAALVTATGSSTKALRLLPLAQNVATASGKDLTASAIAVAKASEGQTKPLKMLGVDLPVVAGGAAKLAKAHDAITAAQKAQLVVEAKVHAGLLKGPAAYLALQGAQQKVVDAQHAYNVVAGTGDSIITALSAKLKGQAAAAADTFGGKIKAVKAKLTDAEAALGMKLIPALDKLGSWVGSHWPLIEKAVAPTLVRVRDIVVQVAQKIVQYGVPALQNLYKVAAGAARIFIQDVLPVLVVVGTAILTVAKYAGERLIPVMQKVGAAVQAVGVFLSKHKEVLLAIAIAIGVVLIPAFVAWTVALATTFATWVAGAAAAAVATVLAAAPIVLLTAGIALLVLGVIELVKHWQGAWGAIKGAASAVFNWFKSSWPLILAVITGPFGLAVLAIVKNWGTIKSFFAAIPGEIGGFLKTVGTDLAAPFITGFGTVNRWISTAVGWFQAIPGWIKGALSTVGSIVSAPFTTAFGIVARLWNDTVGKISFHVPKWVPGIGGDGFAFPTIKGYATGGIVPGAIGMPQLAIVHGGENVQTPAQQSAAGGDVHYWTVNVFEANDPTKTVTQLRTFARRNGIALT